MNSGRATAALLLILSLSGCYKDGDAYAECMAAGYPKMDSVFDRNAQKMRFYCIRQAANGATEMKEVFP